MNTLYEMFDCETKEELYQKMIAEEETVKPLLDFLTYHYHPNINSEEINGSEALLAYAQQLTPPTKEKGFISFLNAKNKVIHVSSLNFSDDTVYADIIKEGIFAGATAAFLHADDMVDTFQLENFTEKLALVDITVLDTCRYNAIKKTLTTDREGLSVDAQGMIQSSFITQSQNDYSYALHFDEFTSYYGKQALKGLNVLTDLAEVRDTLQLTYKFHRREIFGLVVYDAAYNILGVDEAFTGREATVNMSPASLIRRALQYGDNVKGVLLFHNHPSGIVEPSNADKEIAEALDAALSVCKLESLDHVIVGQKGVYSFVADDRTYNNFGETQQLYLDKTNEAKIKKTETVARGAKHPTINQQAQENELETELENKIENVVIEFGETGGEDFSFQFINETHEGQELTEELLKAMIHDEYLANMQNRGYYKTYINFEYTNGEKDRMRIDIGDGFESNKDLYEYLATAMGLNLSEVIAVTNQNQDKPQENAEDTFEKVTDDTKYLYYITEQAQQLGTYPLNHYLSIEEYVTPRKINDLGYVYGVLSYSEPLSNEQLTQYNLAATTIHEHQKNIEEQKSETVGQSEVGQVAQQLELDELRLLTFENVLNENFELSYFLNENIIRSYKNLIFSFSDYDYNDEIRNYIVEFVHQFKGFVTNENKDALNERLVSYNKLLVELKNNALGAFKIPSSAVVGSGNFPTARKEKQNDRIHQLEGELYSKDGKRARFVENTENMFNPVKIAEREKKKEMQGARAEANGFVSFEQEIEHDSLAAFGIDAENNRVYMKTHGKPDSDTLKILKSAALKWSPKSQRWQRQLTDNALIALEQKVFVPLNIKLTRKDFRPGEVEQNLNLRPYQKVHEVVKYLDEDMLKPVKDFIEAHQIGTYFIVEYHHAMPGWEDGDFVGRPINQDVLDLLKVLDEKYKDGPYYHKFSFMLIKDGKIIDRARLDVGDGVESNIASYKQLVAHIFEGSAILPTRSEPIQEEATMLENSTQEQLDDVGQIAPNETSEVNLDNKRILSNHPKLEFDDFEQAAFALNFEEKPKYYICDCPACGEHEAYVYKNNLNFIKCSRDNNCGEVTRITYKNQIDVNQVKTNYQKKSKIPEYVQEDNIKSMTYLFDNVNQTPEALARAAEFAGIRNISLETLEKADIIFAPINELIKPGVPLLQKFNTEEYADRNVLIGVRNIETNQIERLLMRSLNPKLEKKELQITLKEIDAALFTSIGNKDSDIVVLSEAYIDGLSVIEANPELHVLACTGVNGKNQLADYLIKNKEVYQNKKILLAFDNDKAGITASKEILKKLNDAEFNTYQFTYPDDIKDLNEYLQIDKADLSVQLKQQIYSQDITKLLTNKELDIDIKNTEIQNILTSQIENIRLNPHLLKEYFDFSATFYQYSIKNRLLIQLQRPGAFFVRPFSHWEKMGYSVKKGQKSIRIRVKKEVSYFKNENQEVKRVSDATDIEKKKIERNILKTFKKAYYPLSGTVFDISQTNIPDADYPKLLPRPLSEEKDVPYVLIKNLIVDIANNEGIYVQFAPIPDRAAKGLYFYDTNEIIVSNEFSEAQQVKTLIHELSHARLHNNASNRDELSKEIIETEAEASAYIICKGIGLNTDDYSLKYLASYADYSNDEFEKAIGRISNHASNILSILKPSVDNLMETINLARAEEKKLKVQKEMGKSMPLERMFSL